MGTGLAMAIRQAHIDYGIEDTRIRKEFNSNKKALEADQKERRKQLEAQHRKENTDLLDVRQDLIQANKDRLEAAIEAAHREFQ